MQKRKTFDYLNIAKGIGILLVVFGHAISVIPNDMKDDIAILRLLVYLIHMPLFFIVSGLLFELNLPKYKKQAKMTFVKRKFQLFMIPYFSFSICLFLFMLFCVRFGFGVNVVERMSDCELTVKGFLQALFLYIRPIDEHLWFSYIMFMVLCINIFWVDVDIRKLLPILYCLYVVTFFINEPELVWKTSRYMLLFVTGRLLYQKWESIENCSLRVYLFICILSTGLYIVTKNNELAVCGIIKPLAEITSTIVVLKLSKKIERFIVGNILFEIGQESYAIYLIHQPYIVPILMIFMMGLGTEVILAVALVTIIGVVVPIFIKRAILSRNRVLNMLILGGK